MTKIVVELDVELLDPEWTEQTLLENLPDYLIHSIQTAERTHLQKFPDSLPYTCNVDDLTVWTRAAYLADAADGKLP